MDHTSKKQCLTASAFADRFEMLAEIGAGTYGHVYKVRDRSTNEFMALKIMSITNEEEGISPVLIREISILRDLRHPHIVALHEVLMDNTDVKLYFEYLEYDLKSYNDTFSSGMPHQKVKAIMYQLCSGLNYIHRNRIIHRDIKPQNILVDNKGGVKIADFGLARSYAFPLRHYTRDVVTWWYRAPEIFMGCTNYTPAIDIWSLGCVFAQLINNFPIFPEDSEISTLFTIFRKLGTPTEETWPELSKLPDYSPLYPQFPKRDIGVHVPSLDAEGVDLLSKMLTLYPGDRITAEEAMRHSYFDDVRMLFPEE